MEKDIKVVGTATLPTQSEDKETGTCQNDAEKRESCTEVDKQSPDTPKEKEASVEQPEEDSDPMLCESYTLSGQTVFGGAALGHAQLLSEGELEIPHFTIDKAQTRAEFTRLRAAINTVTREFEELLKTTTENDVPEAKAFIELHCQILKDESLIAETQDIIRDRLINAEWALSLRLEELRRSFEEIVDDYLMQRVEDIAQVVERVQRVLTGRRRPADTVSQVMSDSSVILIAEDLSPADILILKRRGDISVSGIVVEMGSPTSHSAILARSLGIPMLVNVEGAKKHISHDDIVFLNADEGTVLVNPAPELLPTVSRHIRQLNGSRRRQQSLRTTAAQTADGVRIELFANIALPEDVIDAVRNGAEGIGLFRSEFLFMNRPLFPSEDEQYETYLRVIRAMRDKPVTIRTMDLGGDKLPSEEALESIGVESSNEVQNPALSRRAIRFCIDHPDLFKTQLRAILRAACAGNVRIMIPLVSRTSEISHVKTLIKQCQEELRDRGQKYVENIALGGMIEVPALAFCLPQFLRSLDFVSVGTNDLIQYLLAADRQDPTVSSICNPLHPAVTGILSHIIKTSNRMHKSISVCGEVAADPMFAKLMIGMGLRRLSMSCSSLLPVKERLIEYTIKEAQVFARKIQACSTTRGIRNAVIQCCSGPQELESSPIMRSVFTDEFLAVHPFIS